MDPSSQDPAWAITQRNRGARTRSRARLGLAGAMAAGTRCNGAALYVAPAGAVSNRESAMV